MHFNMLCFIPMRILALDIGMKKTGCAYLDTAVGIPLPMPLITHDSSRELTREVLRIKTERNADRLAIGLPLLPAGTEGEQAAFVRSVGNALAKKGCRIIYVDERYTNEDVRDDDTGAALNILESLSRKEFGVV